MKRLSIMMLCILWMVGMLCTQSFAAEEDTTGVEIHVTAEDKDTGELVDVADAEVSLYIGSALRRTVVTNSDGIAILPISDLTEEELAKATVSAKAEVSHGMASYGNVRTKLYDYYPVHEEDGEPYRYRMELHSSWIDEQGNWCGEELNVKDQRDKVDVVFAIDTTASMSAEIARVRENLEAFTETIRGRGISVRFAIVEYGDITYGDNTIVHGKDGSNWFTDVADVTEVLDALVLGDGGDDDETLIDALGYIADDATMKWRSDAYRFVFVVTDTGYKVDNNHGYIDMEEITDVLADKEIVTSVITTNYFGEVYKSLCEGTGGVLANIYAQDFENEMLGLAEEVVELLTAKMELVLSEPRMYMNLSVCYLIESAKDETEEYKAAMTNMVDELANCIAETTDAHVLIEHVVLYSTDDVLNFYTSNHIASMADIRVESSAYNTSTSYSNSHVSGFYRGYRISMEYEETTRPTFCRVQISGTWAGNSEISILGDVEWYAAILSHECGHYLFGFRDEYVNGSGEYWNPRWNENYGLMDQAQWDIEISKTSVDYTYITDETTFELADQSIHSRQSWTYMESCEDTLADLLTLDSNSTEVQMFGKYYTPEAMDYYNTGDYVGTYTKAPGADRRVTYDFAGLDSGDITVILADGSIDNSTDSASTSSETYGTSTSNKAEAERSLERLVEVSFASQGEKVLCTIERMAGYNYHVNVRVAGDSERKEIAGDGTYVLPIGYGDLAEVRIIAEKDGVAQYNFYYVDRSQLCEKGYIYYSIGNNVSVTAEATEPAYYTFVADNYSYTNGDYISVNQATVVMVDGDLTVSGGEITSATDSTAEIDYSTLSWYVCKDGVWSALETTITREQNMTLSATASLRGEGIYVLMAKKAGDGAAKKAENVTYEQSATRAGVVTLSFDDRNEDSMYYHVYYSDKAFTEAEKDDMARNVHDAFRGTNLTLKLPGENQTVYVAIDIILKDGSHSGLTELMEVTVGELDYDGDGIPDWYCNKYLLWGDGITPKDIAESDDDGDGLTNMEEYLGGSDPTNPNDPVHTTNIPLDSITANKSSIAIHVGESDSFEVSLLPENASNREVSWYIEDESIVSVVTDGYMCTVTGLALGKTKVCGVSMDGGYSAVVVVTVYESVTVVFHGNGGTPEMTKCLTDKDGHITPLPTAVSGMADYEFAGWYTEVTGGTQVTESTVFAEDTDVYARWKPVTADTEPVGDHNDKSGTDKTDAQAEKKGGMPWWYVGIGVGVVIIATVVVFVVKKKQQNASEMISEKKE